jgi:hypothetical protein
VKQDDTATTQSAFSWRFWFQTGIHLATVYVIAYFFSLWLSGRYYAWILPHFDHQPSGALQFSYDHIFAFTFLPGFAAGFVNGQYLRRGAMVAWIIPGLILASRFAVFPASVFQNRFALAFHYYFASGFLIPAFHNYADMFAGASNPDIWRGLAQFHFTGPFYAGLGYALAMLVAIRVKIPALAQLHDPASSKNTADTAYPAAPDETPHPE